MRRNGKEACSFERGRTAIADLDPRRSKENVSHTFSVTDGKFSLPLHLL